MLWINISNTKGHWIHEHVRWLSVMAAILVRLGVGLWPYSGAGQAPMFGDYEAQRHWMEITYWTPVGEWYVNTSHNDLLYWGLDYPPLTAYHSWLCGAVANWIHPSWVSLAESRGHESPSHKLFMRNSVLIIDVLLYIPAVLLFSKVFLRHLSLTKQASVELLILLQPSVLLIDHGHFQFNNASLGLCLLAVTAVCCERDFLGSILFSLALNYKQMELYHSVPFFCYLLGKSLKKPSWTQSASHVLTVAVVVVLTFAICWLPFLFSTESILQVLHRVFPFARGVFEDKVASVWCTLSILVKYSRMWSLHTIIRASLVLTLLALLPSALHLLLQRRPTAKTFKLALVNSSLAFFLFSFHVHEKSILLSVMPVSLLLADCPTASTWFTSVSLLSMYPLLVKDGLSLPTWATLVMYLMLSVVTWWEEFRRMRKSLLLLPITSIASLSVLCLASHVVSPPQRYPDLFPVVISALSCFHFTAFLMWFQWLQITQPCDKQKTG